ncbi:helix-turn-helix domain-containing protein [Lentzea sp. NPDC060358]|uniref:helix-turn-helix domain-containing protein n=1 Tax=Lentzea sp. NPDC060358 TaxID=3347103 RepID=UPI00364A3D86
MTTIASTACSRDLGDELRRLRESATSFSGRAMAAHLGWDPSKVSNIEHGKVRATEVDLVQWVATCGKNLEYLEEFRSRYRHAFDAYFVQLPENLRTLAMTEAKAHTITSYEVIVLPGLLQTREYARALLREGGIEAPEDVEAFVQARVERQSILHRVYRPECLFYVHELALQTLVGDAVVMESQYLRLLFKTHVLRVVPANVRTVPQSKLTLYEFDKAQPVVFSETDMAQVFAQDDTAVKRARRMFNRLDAVALDPEQSRSKLAEYVSGLREDFHARRTDLA